MRTTRQLADYVLSTGYNDIAPEVVQRTKDLCLSTLGSAVLGASMDVTKVLADYARTQRAPEESGVIGSGFRTSAELAAMVNSSGSHNTELEDVSFPEAMPTVNIIPAVFAIGQKLGATGKAVLEGVVLAFELSARPATVLTPGDGGIFDRGFQPGPQLAPVGVAAIAAKMMGMSPEQTVNAMSLGASFGCGLVRQTGSGAHVIEPGLAGRNGITAALFARQGMTGEPTILEGKSGFWDALGGHPELDFELGTAANFRIMEVGVKRYPCCYFLQRIIDGAVDLVNRHAIKAEDVECVEVAGNKFFRLMIRQDTPTNGEEARFSLPHSISAALTGDRVFFETFTLEAVNNPRYTSLWDKVKFTHHQHWLANEVMEHDNPVTIHMKNGEEFSASCVVHKGDPRNPLTQDEVIQRFKYCAENSMSETRMDEIASMMYGLDNAGDVGPLMDLLTSSI